MGVDWSGGGGVCVCVCVCECSNLVHVIIFILVNDY